MINIHYTTSVVLHSTCVFGVMYLTKLLLRKAKRYKWEEYEAALRRTHNAMTKITIQNDKKKVDSILHRKQTIEGEHSRFRRVSRSYFTSDTRRVTLVIK